MVVQVCTCDALNFNKYYFPSCPLHDRPRSTTTVSTMPDEVRGDTPCEDCGTDKNIVWSTDNVFWNDVMGDEKSLILCVPCFVIRAEAKYRPTGWRLIPEFQWTETDKTRKQ